ncbi:MAG TPA: hypothetical protein VKK79_22640, partial [Candidatus Lokiarchaeia archaeon]|nr:hypothetical protein [Candidatus Lokiarchaeia archaeon]
STRPATAPGMPRGTASGACSLARARWTRWGMSAGRGSRLSLSTWPGGSGGSAAAPSRGKSSAACTCCTLTRAREHLLLRGIREFFTQFLQ